eukprot:12401820-Karenia_brevis.AAC.1
MTGKTMSPDVEVSEFTHRVVGGNLHEIQIYESKAYISLRQNGGDGGGERLTAAVQQQRQCWRPRQQQP